jgi:hypothetical protein
MKFTYSSGQRPLEGYTIKRGIGQGGFGEVYYGLSDGGKEVALKLIRGNLEVELRGMSQCLNFKHPNLVSLYDLRADGHGDQWVIMEYVAGDTLNTILSRHPDGLAPELVRQWFGGLAAAVGYLHEHGIVHRDLKPGNIFIEQGLVKVGDYGLCKFISGSQRTAQTQSVGTVHYMAPEISTGNYNKQIDMYAVGIILYEMLTGHVPFEGESAGEILMKHLTTPPDLSKLPFDFVPIVSKALAKNPAQRYSVMGEMAREVAGLASGAIPQVLPVTAGSSAAAPAPVTPDAIPSVVPVTLRTRVAELGNTLIMAALLSGLLAILWAAVVQTNDLKSIGGYFFLTLACSWAVLLPARLWSRRIDDSWRRRVAMMSLGVLIGLQTLWLEGHDLGALFSTQARAAQADAAQTDAAAPARPNPARRPVEDNDLSVGDNESRHGLFSARDGLPVAACYLSYFGLAFFVLRWWKMADRNRPQRFSLYAVLAAGFWAYVLLFLWSWPSDQTRTEAIASLVMTAVIVQLVSPWDQPAPKQRSRKLRLRSA